METIALSIICAMILLGLFVDLQTIARILLIFAILFSVEIFISGFLVANFDRTFYIKIIIFLYKKMMPHINWYKNTLLNKNQSTAETPRLRQ